MSQSAGEKCILLTRHENTIAAIPIGRQQHNVLKMDQPKYVGAPGVPDIFRSVLHSWLREQDFRRNEGYVLAAQRY